MVFVGLDLNSVSLSGAINSPFSEPLEDNTHDEQDIVTEICYKRLGKDQAALEKCEELSRLHLFPSVLKEELENLSFFGYNSDKTRILITTEDRICVISLPRSDDAVFELCGSISKDNEVELKGNVFLDDFDFKTYVPVSFCCRLSGGILSLQGGNKIELNGLFKVGDSVYDCKLNGDSLESKSTLDEMRLIGSITPTDSEGAARYSERISTTLKWYRDSSSLKMELGNSLVIHSNLPELLRYQSSFTNMVAIRIVDAHWVPHSRNQFMVLTDEGMVFGFDVTRWNNAPYFVLKTPFICLSYQVKVKNEDYGSSNPLDTSLAFENMNTVFVRLCLYSSKMNDGTLRHTVIAMRRDGVILATQPSLADPSFVSEEFSGENTSITHDSVYIIDSSSIMAVGEMNESTTSDIYAVGIYHFRSCGILLRLWSNAVVDTIMLDEQCTYDREILDLEVLKREQSNLNKIQLRLERFKERKKLSYSREQKIVTPVKSNRITLGMNLKKAALNYSAEKIKRNTPRKTKYHFDWGQLKGRKASGQQNDCLLLARTSLVGKSLSLDWVRLQSIDTFCVMLCSTKGSLTASQLSIPFVEEAEEIYSEMQQLFETPERFLESDMFEISCTSIRVPKVEKHFLPCLSSLVSYRFDGQAFELTDKSNLVLDQILRNNVRRRTIDSLERACVERTSPNFESDEESRKLINLIKNASIDKTSLLFQDLFFKYLEIPDSIQGLSFDEKHGKGNRRNLQISAAKWVLSLLDSLIVGEEGSKSPFSQLYDHFGSLALRYSEQEQEFEKQLRTAEALITELTNIKSNGNVLLDKMKALSKLNNLATERLANAKSKIQGNSGGVNVTEARFYDNISSNCMVKVESLQKRVKTLLSDKFERKQELPKHLLGSLKYNQGISQSSLQKVASLQNEISCAIEEIVAQKRGYASF